MKKDILISAAIGFLTGLFLIPTLKNNEITIPAQNLALLIGLPIISAIGMVAARIIGKYLRVVYQLGKFVLTGIFNASIDFGVLNILIAATGLSAGMAYTGFKAASFIVANINSYFWNRSWTFEGTGNSSGGYLKFLAVSIGGLIINVGVASAVVNLINPTLGLDAKQWANIGAACGSIAGLMWNFLGYKFIVFVSRK